MTPELKTYAWAYAEERFGRSIIRVSLTPLDDAQPLVLKAEAEKLIAAALSQADAYRVDAERYRWIEDNATSHGGGKGFTLQVFVPHDMEDWGCAIDAARKPA